MKTMIRSLSILAVCLCFSNTMFGQQNALTLSSTAPKIQMLQASSGSGLNSKVGGKCKITGGTNAGQTGTYTKEDGNGHIWCSGSFGGTECNSDPKKSKCKDAKIASTPPRVVINHGSVIQVKER